MNYPDTAQAWIRQRELVEIALRASGGPRVPSGSAVAGKTGLHEGVHREHGVVAGQRVRPGRQHRRHAISQACRVAGDVVEGMRHVQRKNVTRLQAQQGPEPCPGAFVVVIQYRGERGQVQSLDLVDRHAGDVGQHRARRSDPVRVAAADTQVSLQHVRHHEAGGFPQRQCQRLFGTLSPTLEQGQRMLVRLQGGGRRTRDRAASFVVPAHGHCASCEVPDGSVFWNHGVAATTGGTAGLNEARTRGIDLTKQFGHG